MNRPMARIEMAPRTRRFMRELAGTDFEDSRANAARDRPSPRRLRGANGSAPVAPQLLVPLLVAACAATLFLGLAWRFGT
jgi:hypothetical protein